MQSMARPLRVEYPGAIYHIVTRGNNRQKVFKNDQDRKIYLQKLADYCADKGVDLLCYCLLSNHIHLLLQTPRGNLSKTMQPLQISYTAYFNKKHRHSGHVFEQRYKAFLVDKDNYLLQVSRYIHLNPVKAEIAKNPRDYPWSSYRAYTGGPNYYGVKRQILLDNFTDQGRKSVVSYRRFVESGIERGSALLDLPIVNQAFIGDRAFVVKATRKTKEFTGTRRFYKLSEIGKAVAKVVGVAEEELRVPVRSESVQVGRELLVYVARKHSDIGLRELVNFLSVKELSTPSHGLRRAEARVKSDAKFRQRIAKVLKVLSHSPIQA